MKSLAIITTTAFLLTSSLAGAMPMTFAKIGMDRSDVGVVQVAHKKKKKHMAAPKTGIDGVPGANEKPGPGTYGGTQSPGHP